MKAPTATLARSGGCKCSAFSDILGLPKLGICVVRACPNQPWTLNMYVISQQVLLQESLQHQLENRSPSTYYNARSSCSQIPKIRVCWHHQCVGGFWSLLLM